MSWEENANEEEKSPGSKLGQNFKAGLNRKNKTAERLKEQQPVR